MNSVGDLVKCIWQPRVMHEDVVCGNKSRKDLDFLIKNEIGIIIKEEVNNRYLILFAHLSYRHILFNGAFVNISEIERERNEFGESLNVSK